MKKIAVVTATRAEYGILRPLICRLQKDTEFELQLIVTGMHLSEKYGNTQVEIEKDKIPVFRKISILEDGNSAYDVSVTMANALCRFAGYFRDEKPDMVIVLGDRTEILGICAAAMNEGIPIAHLHGGELTEGAVDDCIRHAVTKMSYLHFTASETYRNRVIQLGESPDRVFNVGALGVENILHTQLFSYEDMCREIGIPNDQKYVVVTFHPVTQEPGEEQHQTQELIAAMKEKSGYFYLITKANADAGGQRVNELLENFSERVPNAKLVSSLGMVRYLSALKYSEFALGNSSSGIIEAPALGIPTVNIGERQRGRLMADTIVQCKPEKELILEAMDEAAVMPHKVSTLYGDGETSAKIVTILKNFLFCNKINLKKRFYDLE
ncbi:MAG: UDP-N-acetylglucosamine 2-epimerase [Lachnospiraceae bacterium]